MTSSKDDCFVSKKITVLLLKRMSVKTWDSVIQIHCTMQGRTVFGGIHSTACRGKNNSLHSIPLSQ